MVDLVYAISCRSGGAYSVLSDFYEEAKKNKYKYPDVKWLFLLSTQNFSEAENIIIKKYEKSVKSWLHRMHFNYHIAKKIATQYGASVVLSLQNMGITGVNLPTIISLHNVLPLYKCTKDVLDTSLQRCKQRIVNYCISHSLKKAEAVLIPGEWIKTKIVDKFNIDENKIHIAQLSFPLKMELKVYDANTGIDLRKITTFFYPAASYPYKNHKVIIEACRLLSERNIANYEVLFTFTEDQTKTAISLSSLVRNYNIPIRFCGDLPREKVVRLYNSGVLLFSSKIETDAMPLIECKTVGGMVIASDFPYAKAVLCDYENKIMFNGDNPVELADAMEKCIANGFTIIEGNNNYHHTEHGERFDLIVDVAEQIYHNRDGV